MGSGHLCRRAQQQNALLALTDANLAMSARKGTYDATDPSVKTAWRESCGRRAALGLDKLLGSAIYGLSLVLAIGRWSG